MHESNPKPASATERADIAAIATRPASSTFHPRVAYSSRSPRLRSPLLSVVAVATRVASRYLGAHAPTRGAGARGTPAAGAGPLLAPCTTAVTAVSVRRIRPLTLILFAVAAVFLVVAVVF